SKAYPGKDYDLVAFFDCLHDMGDPVGAAKHVLSTLDREGTWMIVEPFAGDRIEQNLNPVGRIYYAASTMVCTPASLAQEVGLAPGSGAGDGPRRRRGLDARVMDGQRLAFDAEFDAVFSNAALHWMTNPERVIAGVWRALRPGGRFVGELGGRGCVARIVAALRAALARQGVDESRIQPWYFPGDDEYRARLEAHGFTVRSSALIPRPTSLP